MCNLIKKKTENLFTLGSLPKFEFHFNSTVYTYIPTNKLCSVLYLFLEFSEKINSENIYIDKKYW